MGLWAERLRGKKEVGWTAVAQFLLVAQGLLQVKILATLLTKAEYGEWALLISLALLLGMLPFSAFDQGFAKLRGERRHESQKRENALLAQVAIIYFAMFTAWSSAVIVAVLVVDSKFLGTSLTVLTFALTEVFRNAAISITNAARKRRTVALHRAWDVAGKSAALLALASAGRLEPTSALLALSFANLIGLTFYGVRLVGAPIGNVGELRQTWLRVAAFSWPLAVWAIFGWSQSMISRWYLSEWATSEAVASFAVIVSVGMFAPNFAYTILASYLLPILYGLPEPMPPERYRLMVATFAATLGVYTLTTVPLSGLLLKMLTDAKYEVLAAYVPWVTASTSLYFVASLYAAELFRAGATKKLLGPTIAPGLLSIAFGFVLIPRYTLDGAVATFIIGQVVYAAAASAVTFAHFRQTR